MGQSDLQILESERVAALTQREREVLVFLTEGLSVKEIGVRMNIAESTAGIHVSRIYEKLGVKNAVNALRCAIRTGLIIP